MGFTDPAVAHGAVAPLPSAKGTGRPTTGESGATQRLTDFRASGGAHASGKVNIQGGSSAVRMFHRFVSSCENGRGSGGPHEKYPTERGLPDVSTVA